MEANSVIAAERHGPYEEAPIPPDIDADSDGAQLQGTALSTEVKTTPALVELAPTHEYVSGLVEKNPKWFFNNDSTRLMTNLLQNAERTIERKEYELRAKNSELHQLREKFNQLFTDSEVLKERHEALKNKVDEVTSEQYVRGLVAAFGTWMFGVGIDQLKASTGFNMVATVLTVGGVLMALYAIAGKAWKRGARK